MKDIHIRIAQRSHATNHPTRFEIEIDGKPAMTVHRLQTPRPKPWLVSPPGKLKSGYSYADDSRALAAAVQNALGKDHIESSRFVRKTENLTGTLKGLILNHIKASGPVSEKSCLSYARDQYPGAVLDHDITKVIGDLVADGNVEPYDKSTWW